MSPPTLHEHTFYCSVHPRLTRLLSDKRQAGFIGKHGWLSKPHTLATLRDYTGAGGAVNQVFRGGEREDEHLLGYVLVPVDIDAPRIDELRAHPVTREFANVTGISASGNCRALFPLQEGIPADTPEKREYLRCLVRRFLYQFRDMDGYDGASETLSQQWNGFRRGTAADGGGRFLTLADLEALPPTPAELKAAEEERRRRERAAQPRPVVSASRLEAWHRGCVRKSIDKFLSVAGPGNRHEPFKTLCSQVIGWQKSGAAGLEGVAADLRDAGVHGGLSEREAERMIRWAEKIASPKEPPPLPDDTPPGNSGKHVSHSPDDAPEPAYMREVPQSRDAAVRRYMSPLTLCILHVIEQGDVDRNGFTADDVQAAGGQMSPAVNIPARTIRSVLSRLDGQFWQKTDVYIGGSTTSKSCQNSVGRPATTYHLLPDAEREAAILRYALPRIVEACFPTQPTQWGGEVLAEITPPMLAAIGVPMDDLALVLDQLRPVLQPVFEKQRDKGVKAMRKVHRIYARLRANIRQRQRLELPPDWTISKASDHDAARMSAIHDAAPGEARGYKDWAGLLGVDTSAIPALMRHAGLENQQQTDTQTPITSAQNVFQQIATAGRVKQGHVFGLVAKSPDGRLVGLHDYEDRETRAETPVFVANALAKGATVYIEMRTPGKAKRVRTTPPVHREPRTPIVSPTVNPSAPERDAAPGAVHPRRFYGASHNPVWVTEQLRLALRLLWGEIPPPEASAHDLLALLIGAPEPAPPLDPRLLTLRELGGVGRLIEPERMPV